MADIYKQHEAAFSRVSSYVVMRHGKLAARVAFKFPADGAGRLYCYVHWLGLPMVRGYAGGYGYDKKSAAASLAGRKMEAKIEDPEEAKALWNFKAQLSKDDGYDWDRRLRDAGFDVIQAI